MDSLLILAIEAEKEAKRKQEHVCKMAGAVDDVQKAVLNIGKSLYALKGDLQATQDAAIAAAKMAEKAAAKKPPKPPDYVMDVVRDDKDKITRIDVRAV